MRLQRNYNFKPLLNEWLIVSCVILADDAWHPSTIAKETLASAAPFLFFHFSKSLTTSCFNLLMFGLFICTTTSFQLFRRVSTGFRQPLYKGRKQCSPSSVTSYFPWVVVIYGVKDQAFRQTSNRQHEVIDNVFRLNNFTSELTVRKSIQLRN